MNKKEIAQAVAERLVLSPSLVEGIVDAVHEEIVEAMARGERVTFWNFGRWELKTTAARVGREFKTGKSVVIPERNKVCFTASPNLVAAVEDAMKTLCRSGTRETKGDAVRNGCRPFFAHAGFAPERRPPV